MSTETENAIQAAFDAYLSENAKFEAGNASAGTRARSALGDLGKLTKTRRAEIQETKNARAEEKKSA